MHLHLTAASIFKLLELQWGANLAPAMPASSLDTRNILSGTPTMAPCLIKRYMDDIIGATSLPLEALQNFIDYTNNFHPALQFTHNITEHTWPFLDIQFTIEDETIATSIYYKDTDAHSFLDYNSSHPSKCKDSVPYSQFRRLRRICSNDEDFHSKAKEMTSFFHQNDYPKKITTSAFQKVNNLTQEFVSTVPWEACSIP